MEHEYCVLNGLNRAVIGRYLAILSAIISAGIINFVVYIIFLLKEQGYGFTIPTLISWPVSAGIIYFFLYWLFSKNIWKWKIFRGYLKVPDLSGSWNCEGRTLNEDKSIKYEWKATVTIYQDWDRIRVRLKTDQSGSNSVAASLSRDGLEGYRLLYHYENDPHRDQVDLRPHRGFADLMFDKNLQTAEGEYFNGFDRFTAGTMKLTKVS